MNQHHVVKMRFNFDRKTSFISDVFLFALLIAKFCATLQIVSAQPPCKEPPAFAAEETQLLEHLRTEVAAYDEKFTSGEVEFSITLSEPLSFPIPRDKKDPLYEDKGYWHITYRFDEECQFYEVKTRKKMELNGQPLPNWQETHYQYRIDGNQRLHIRENASRGGWKQHPPRAIPSRIFEQQFNPRWWSWPPHGFTFEQFLSLCAPVDVYSVKMNDTAYQYLSLYCKADGNDDTSSTIEIWMHPQKDYHATRMVTYNRRSQQTLLVGADGTATLSPPRAGLSLTREIYHLAQYEPGIWFPKTVTNEHFHGYPMEQIFSDMPEAEYPVMITESLIPQAALAEHFTWPNRKLTMQVHRAVFNIPIEKKDLRFTD